MARASGLSSGENKTYDARATWKTPSEAWLVSRTAEELAEPGTSQQLTKVSHEAHGQQVCRTGPVRQTQWLSARRHLG